MVGTFNILRVKKIYRAAALLTVALTINSCGQNDQLGSSLRETLFNTRPFPGSFDVASRASLMHLNVHSDELQALNNQIKQITQDERLSVIALNGDSLQLVQASGSRLYGFQFRGAEFCDKEMRASGSGDDVVALGNIPELGGLEIDDREFDAQEGVLLAEQELSARNLAFSGVQLQTQRDCWIKNGNNLSLAKDLTVTADELPYRTIVANGKILRMEPKYFDVAGSARVYDSNPLTGSLKDFSLTDLIGDGTLENDHFTTSTTGTKADNSSHKFVYSTSDGRFDETSMFVHVNEQLDWFKSIGYKWTSSDKLNLYVHAVVSGTVNNALYTPAIGDAPPKIQVGDGDGIRLRNLPKDSDVVAHEFGHHVVYDTLKSTRGESLIIHEGLADYFAFARVNDACLGESICPAGSPIGCEVEEQCLRSGKNDYVLNVNTKSEAHFKSQFVSGMLWDLRGDEVPADKLDKIVFNGIGLLLSESGYHDLVLSFLLADRKLNKGKYCKAIYKVAVARGLKDYIADFSCGDSDLPMLTGVENASGETVSSEPTTSTSTGGGGALTGCTIGGGHAARAEPMDIAMSLITLLLGMFAPTMVTRLRKYRHY